MHQRVVLSPSARTPTDLEEQMRVFSACAGPGARSTTHALGRWLQAEPRPAFKAPNMIIGGNSNVVVKRMFGSSLRPYSTATCAGKSGRTRGILARPLATGGRTTLRQDDPAGSTSDPALLPTPGCLSQLDLSITPAETRPMRTRKPNLIDAHAARDECESEPQGKSGTARQNLRNIQDSFLLRNIQAVKE